MSKTKLEMLQVKLDEAREQFLSSIKVMTREGPYSNRRKKSTDFELIHPANNTYYEYAYYERAMISMIRDMLVNPILCSVLLNNSRECLIPNFNGTYVHFSNEKIEDVFPFEFIICDGEQQIGCRYTSVAENDKRLIEITKENDIDSIVILRWDTKPFSPNTQTNLVVPIVELSLKEFFDRFASDEECNAFLQHTRESVSIANRMLGFETIPRLSTRYLSEFNQKTLEMLYDLDFESMEYQPISGNFINKAFADADKKIMTHYFKDEGLVSSLIGPDEFARCFITSEYLYTVLGEGYNFDYTSVVTGYIKSIEQLVYKVMKCQLDYNYHLEDLWVKKNSKRCSNKIKRDHPITGKKQVKFKKENEHLFDVALSPMIWLLYDNDIGWNVSKGGRDTVKDIALRYCTECRNDYFHKDNIFDYDNVEKIRNNTLLLIYLILGACCKTGNTKLDSIEFNANSYEFDKLYRAVNRIPKGINKFKCIDSNGETLYLVRESDQPDINYDEYGSISMSEIRFRNASESVEKNNSSYVLCKENIPSKLWYKRYNGDYIEITW